MVVGKYQKIVNIKNISSNVIEEVIIVLKSNTVQNASELDKKSNVERYDGARKRILLKEAEQIVSDYIKQSQNGVKKNQDIKVQNHDVEKNNEKSIKKKNSTSLLIDFSVIISALILLFTVSNLI